MQLMSSLATTFGLGRDGSTEGRRRLIGLLAFISFCLVIAATSGRNWVAGAIDFNVDGATASSTAHFRVDLSNVVIEFQAAPDAWSPSGQTAFITYTRSAWMARQILAATEPGCVRGETHGTVDETNWWCGLAITAFNKDIDAVYGLMIFSCLLITAAWLMTTALGSGASSLFDNPRSFQVLAGLLFSGAFFNTVAILAFVGAKISPTFCSVFEGPVNQQNDTILNYCGYHDAFGVAIASAVMTGVTALLTWFWMPWTPPSSGNSSTAPAAAAGGSYSNIGAEETKSVAVASPYGESFNA